MGVIKKLYVGECTQILPILKGGGGQVSPAKIEKPLHPVMLSELGGGQSLCVVDD